MQTIYYAADSFLHRLNPLSKFVISLLLLAFMLVTTDPWTPLAFALLTIVVLRWLGKVPWVRLWRVLFPILLIAGTFAIFYPFIVRQSLVNNTPLLLDWGLIKLYEGGLQYGLAIGMRVLALLILSLPFSLTTDSADFIRALVQQWRLPYRIGYSSLAAFRFVPMLQTELSVIGAAHRVRGVNGSNGLRGNYERLRRYAVPLLATAIREAERTALAMDGRAFAAFPQRTYFRKMRFALSDWGYLGGMLVASALLIAGLAWAGLLGPLALIQIL